MNQHPWLALVGITAAVAGLTWVVTAPLIYVALVIGQHRREKARKLTLDVHLDGVDVTRYLDRNGLNGGKL